MSDVVTIIVDGPPVGKGRPRFVRATGRVYTPAETEGYENCIRLTGRVAMKGRPLLLGPLEVGVVALVAIPQSWSANKRRHAELGVVRPTSRPDGDNFLKIALDALNGTCWRDDAQVTDITLRKRYSAHPALQIFVREITASELMATAA